ncbi:MAG: hypothetical protein ACEPOW_09520, partial [Bacteroidales bacterium]
MNKIYIIILTCFLFSFANAQTAQNINAKLSYSKMDGNCNEAISYKKRFAEVEFSLNALLTTDYKFPLAYVDQNIIAQCFSVNGEHKLPYEVIIPAGELSVKLKFELNRNFKDLKDGFSLLKVSYPESKDKWQDLNLVVEKKSDAKYIKKFEYYQGDSKVREVQFENELSSSAMPCFGDKVKGFVVMEDDQDTYVGKWDLYKNNTTIVEGSNFLEFDTESDYVLRLSLEDQCSLWEYNIE